MFCSGHVEYSGYAGEVLGFLYFVPDFGLVGAGFFYGFNYQLEGIVTVSAEWVGRCPVRESTNKQVSNTATFVFNTDNTPFD